MLRLLGGLTLMIAAGFTYTIWWPPVSNWVDAHLLSLSGDGEDKDLHEPANRAIASTDPSSLILT